MKTAKNLAKKGIIVTEETLALGLLLAALGAAKFSTLCAKGGVKLVADIARRAAESDFISDEKRQDIAKMYAEITEALARIKL